MNDRDFFLEEWLERFKPSRIVCLIGGLMIGGLVVWMITHDLPCGRIANNELMEENARLRYEAEYLEHFAMVGLGASRDDARRLADLIEAKRPGLHMAAVKQ